LGGETFDPPDARSAIEVSKTPFVQRFPASSPPVATGVAWLFARNMTMP